MAVPSRPLESFATPAFSFPLRHLYKTFATSLLYRWAPITRTRTKRVRRDVVYSYVSIVCQRASTSITSHRRWAKTEFWPSRLQLPDWRRVNDSSRSSISRKAQLLKAFRDHISRLELTMFPLLSKTMLEKHAGCGRTRTNVDSIDDCVLRI